MSKISIPEPLENTFKKYLLYDTTFARFICKLENARIFDFPDNGEITVAEEEDASEIDRLFNETFSHHSSHLPDMDELIRHIKNGEVLVFKKPKIVAVTMYKKKNKVINSDQTLNIDNNFETLLRLLNFLHIHLKKINADSYFSWIDIEKNNKFLRMLTHFFKIKADGLSNIIYINKLLMKDVLKYKDK